MRAFTELIFIDGQDGGAGKLVAKFFQRRVRFFQRESSLQKFECDAVVAQLKM
jgi:hypothetical protein